MHRALHIRTGRGHRILSGRSPGEGLTRRTIPTTDDKLRCSRRGKLPTFTIETPLRTIPTSTNHNLSRGNLPTLISGTARWEYQASLGVRLSRIPSAKACPVRPQNGTRGSCWKASRQKRHGNWPCPGMLELRGLRNIRQENGRGLRKPPPKFSRRGRGVWTRQDRHREHHKSREIRPRRVGIHREQRNQWTMTQ